MTDSGLIPKAFENISSVFKIGLTPLKMEEWLDVDKERDTYLREKQHLNSAHFDDVFVAEENTKDSQREVLELVCNWLNAHTKIKAKPEANGLPPLLAAANLIQEDLVLMRRDEEGWRLVAASVCFPTHWNLREKFGKPISRIHGPVPDFGPDSRNDIIINRIFDNLAVDIPAERQNWSLVKNATLPHIPKDEPDHIRCFEKDVFVRIERQGLIKLPKSGDILFSIRIYVKNLDTLEKHPEKARIFASLIDGIDELTDDQLRYKSIAKAKHFLLGELEKRRKNSSIEAEAAS